PRRLALLAGLDRREVQRLTGGVLRDPYAEHEGVAHALGQRRLGGVDDLGVTPGDALAVGIGDRLLQLLGDGLQIPVRVDGRRDVGDRLGDLDAYLRGRRAVAPVWH